MAPKMGTIAMTAALWAVSGGALAAETPDLLGSALKGGATTLDVRLRAESVDNEAAATPRDSTATTLRARLGFTSSTWNAFDLGVEYEGVTAFDGLDYNSTTNGQTQRPVIGDPKGSELNQAFVRYAGLPDTTFTAGRTRLTLDNQRWVGNAGWRQNEQTYDGAVLVNKGLPGVEFTYAYLHNVNSVFFTDYALRGNLANVAWSPSARMKAVVYGYALDFSAPNTGNRQDSFTAGARLTGAPQLTEALKLIWAAEYARQMEYEEADPAADAPYYLAEIGGALAAGSLKLGYEVLGSHSGLYAVQTPLATAHAFDGWDDMFLVTPAAGLRRSYAQLTAVALGATLTLVAHEFRADFGSADYGTEADASLGYAFSPKLSALAKLAHYDAHAFGADTDKGWLQLEYRL